MKADGTFDAVPGINYQLYTLLRRCLTHYCQTKQNQHSRKCRRPPKNCPEKHPEIILIDFVKEAIIAFKNAFPDAAASGCRVYLTQSITRHCDGALMKNKYINYIEFRSELKVYQLHHLYKCRL